MENRLGACFIHFVCISASPFQRAIHIKISYKFNFSSEISLFFFLSFFFFLNTPFALDNALIKYNRKVAENRELKE